MTTLNYKEKEIINRILKLKPTWNLNNITVEEKITNNTIYRICYDGQRYVFDILDNKIIKIHTQGMTDERLASWTFPKPFPI